MVSKPKIVLAYSGGLDTSVAIPWIQERYDADVITLTVNLGQERNLDEIKSKALKTGAKRAVVVDLKETFIRDYVWPSLQAGTMYESQYPLATALARPLIASKLVEVALEENAFAVAHGCTGKGNDQVRFDLGVAALAPHLKIIAPARQWSMTREEEIQYAKIRGIPISVTTENPYSIDENIWGRSIEAGLLEDPWTEPPEEIFAWTKSIDQTPTEALYIELTFQNGIPTKLNGEDMNHVALVDTLNKLAGEHGVGRIDHLENRLVGIKSREVYESPSGILLHKAHRALETLTLSKEQQRFKEIVSQQYADLIYNGLWYSGHRADLDSYVKSTQTFVTGTVRVCLHKGNCLIVGRHSPFALYSFELATYDKEDQYDHQSAEGFINVYGLPTRTQARSQPRN